MAIRSTRPSRAASDARAGMIFHAARQKVLGQTKSDLQAMLAEAAKNTAEIDVESAQVLAPLLKGKRH